MGRVHLLPGTTTSSVAERGDYNSAKSATMTLAEFEAWLALEIAGRYHRDSPRPRYLTPRRLRSGTQARLVPSLPADPRQFTLHFLPMEIRSLRKDGIHLFNIRYCSERLSLIAHSGEDLVVRYDPRNLGRIYVLGRDYHDVVYADVRHRPISLWEQRFARQTLREQQRRVDETAIFNILDQQHAIVADVAGDAKRSPSIRAGRQHIRSCGSELRFTFRGIGKRTAGAAAVTLDLSHLAKDVLEQAFEPSAVRARHVQEARWITYERVQRVLDELEWRFDYPTCSRMP